MSERNMQDPGEGSSSSAYRTTTVVHPSVSLDPDATMPEAGQTYDSDSELSSVPSTDDPNLLAIVRGEIIPDQLVPPRFGSDRSYPFISPVRTNVPFPEGWTEAQKAAAISPNSPYYTLSNPPRVFPPDWAPNQIAAANSPTSPHYVPPGTPITNTTPRVPASLPGLFTNVGASAQPSQGLFGGPRQLTPEEQAIWDAGLFHGLPLPPGFDPSNPPNPNPGQAIFGQSPFQSSTHQSHPSINFASASEHGNPLTPTQTVLQFVNPGTLMLHPPQSATPASSTPFVPLLAPGRTGPIFPPIEEKRDKSYPDDLPRIWARPEDRPAALQPVSRIAKFGKEAPRDLTKFPIGGPDPANAPVCANCSKRRDDLRAELEPRVRVEETARIRTELEPQLREHVAATMEYEHAQRMTDLLEENEKLKQDNTELWCEKDQQSHDFTAGLMEQNLEFHGDVDELVKELKNAATIDDKIHHLARLLALQRALANPNLTPGIIEKRAQQLVETQMPKIKAEFMDKHSQLEKDLNAELVKLQNDLEMKHNDRFAKKQHEFETLLATKQQEFDTLLAIHQEGFTSQPMVPEIDFSEWLVEQQEDLDNIAKEQMEAEFTTQAAQPQEQAQAQPTQSHEEYQAQFAQQLTREMEEELKGPIREQLIAAVQADMQVHVEQKIRAECQENIRGQVEQTIRAECEEMVRAEVEQRLQAAYEGDIRGQMEQKIRAECEDTIRGQVEQKIRAECEEMIRRQVEQGLQAEYENKIRGQVEQKIRAECEDFIRGQVEQKIRAEYEDSIRGQVEQKIRAECEDTIRGQVEQKIRAEYEDTIREQVEQKIRAECEEIIRRQVEQEIRAKDVAQGQVKTSPKPTYEKDLEEMLTKFDSQTLTDRVTMEEAEKKFEAKILKMRESHQKQLNEQTARIQKKLDAEKAGLQKKLKAENAGLQQKLDAEKAGMQKLEAEKAEIQKELETEKAEVQKKLEAEKAEVQKKLDAEKAGIRKLEAENAKVQKKLEAEKAEVQKKLDEEKAKIQTKPDEKQAAIQKLEAEKAEIQKNSEAKLAEVLKKLDEEKAKIQTKPDAEKAEMKKKFEMALGEIQKRYDAKLAGVLKKLDEEKTEIQTNFGEEKAEIQKLKAEKAEIQKQLEAEKAEVQKKLDAETAKMQAQYDAQRIEETQKLQKDYEEKLSAAKPDEALTSFQEKYTAQMAEMQSKTAEMQMMGEQMNAEVTQIKQKEKEKYETKLTENLERLNKDNALMMETFKANLTRMQEVYDARLAKEILTVQQDYEEKLSAATSRNAQDLPQTMESQRLTKAMESPSTSKAIESQDSSKSVDTQESSKSADTQDFSKSVDTKDSSRSVDIQDSSKSVDIQDSSKSDDIQDSSKSDDTKDSSKSDDIQDSPKSVDSQDLPKSVVTQDSSKSVDTQDSSKSVGTRDSSKSVDTRDSSKSVDTQDLSKSAAFQDLLRAKLNEEVAETRNQFHQQFEEACTKMHAELNGKYSEEIAEIKKDLRAEYEKKCKNEVAVEVAKVQEAAQAELDAAVAEVEETSQAHLDTEYDKLEETVRADVEEAIREDLELSFKSQIEEERAEQAKLREKESAELERRIRSEEKEAAMLKYNEDCIKLEETVRADSQRIFQKQLDDERLKLKREQKIGKTDGQDAKKSAKTDGQGAESNPVAKQLKELQDKNKLLQADLEAERSSLSALSKELADKARHEQATAKLLESSHTRIGSLETALEASNESLQQTKMEASAKDDQYVNLREKMDDALRDQIDAYAETKAAKETVDKEVLARHEAETNFTNLKEANDRLLEANNELASGLRAREPSAIQATLDLVRKEKAGLEVDLQRTTAEKDRLKSRVGSRFNEVRQCRVELAALQRNLDAANSDTVAKTRDLQVVRQAQAGYLADISKLKREKAALAEAGKASKEGHLPWWLIWLFMLLAFVSSFVFCGFSLFCFLGLAAEREAQQWLGGNDLPRAAIISSVGWGVGEWRIW